jgi:diketogulonate reductase-like aldo/keto reductase
MPKHAVQGITRSLTNLNIDSLDLVQLYWNDYSIRKFVPAAQYLAEEQQRGRIAHIGVTNFDVKRLQEIVDSDVAIVSNQVGLLFTDSLTFVTTTIGTAMHLPSVQLVICKSSSVSMKSI